MTCTCKKEGENFSCSFEFTAEHKKNLNAAEQQELRKVFHNYDLNKNGTIEDHEFKNVMKDLGYRKITDDKVKEMIKEHDHNNDGVLSWDEFVHMMIGFKGKDDGRFG